MIFLSELIVLFELCLSKSIKVMIFENKVIFLTSFEWIAPYNQHKQNTENRELIFFLTSLEIRIIKITDSVILFFLLKGLLNRTNENEK